MGEYKTLNLDDLLIWSDNPRHFFESNSSESKLNEEDVINILIEVVGTNKMLNLITDIFNSNGLLKNTFPTVVLKGAKYNVYDGNRRISSLKILKNPAIVQDGTLRCKVEKLVKDHNLEFLEKVEVYITDEKEALEIMDKTHNGELGGVGLLPWNPYQRDISLVKRGISAKYPIAHKIANAMKYKDMNQMKIPYTDLNRLFGSQKLRDCFEIDIENIDQKENESKIKYAIQLLIKYKKVKNFESFSRHFNITNTKEDTAPILEFCNWVKKQEEDRNTIFFESNEVAIFKLQNYEFALHHFKILNNERKPIKYSLSELTISYTNPSNQIVSEFDSQIVGKWFINIKYKSQVHKESIIVKNLLSPKIEFIESNKINNGTTLNLKTLIATATNGYGENVKDIIEITPLNGAKTIKKTLDKDNRIGCYDFSYSFTDVTGEPYAKVQTIQITNEINPLTSSEKSTSFLSFNGDPINIDINSEVNELVKELNNIENIDKFKNMVAVSLRTVIELTFDELQSKNIIDFTNKSILENSINEFKSYTIDNNNLTRICNYDKNLSFKTEKNTLQLINAAEVSAYLNLATHKGTRRIDETKLKEYGTKIISPILVYSSILLK